MTTIENYAIQYPDQTDEAFTVIRNLITETPLSLCRLQVLRDAIENEIRLERDQYHLFTVGNRTRDAVRGQFGVLCQVLELNSIGVIRLRPERDNGELKWTITHRSWLVSAILVLRATDDTWEIRPIVHSKSKRKIMTVKEKQDTIALNDISLNALLKKQGVDLDGLGGWKVAS
jgi:hypothetical protein